MFYGNWSDSLCILVFEEDSVHKVSSDHVDPCVFSLWAEIYVLFLAARHSVLMLNNLCKPFSQFQGFCY